MGAKRLYILLKIILLPFIIKPLNAKLNPLCHLMALLGAHPILRLSRIRVNKVMLVAVKWDVQYVTWVVHYVEWVVHYVKRDVHCVKWDVHYVKWDVNYVKWDLHCVTWVVHLC